MTCGLHSVRASDLTGDEMTSSSASTSTFTCVRIPADDSEPPEELSLTTSQLGDSLSELLKPRFAGGSVKNVEGLRAEYGDAVDDKMAQLSMIASQGTVEIFALVRPASTTMPVPHSGTYFYFDEMGVLKDLPVNRRAAQLAASCGLDVESPFCGDVFIGRVAINPSPTRNVSFALSELDSSSPFLRSAPSENAQYQAAMAEYEKAAREKTQATTSGGGGGASTATSSSAEPTVPGSYKWAQTPDDLEITVVLPPGTAKQAVRIDLGLKTLKVSIKGQDAPLVDLKLYAAVRPEESTWTIDAKKAVVQLMAEKAETLTWNRFEAATEGQMV